MTITALEVGVASPVEGAVIGALKNELPHTASEREFPTLQRSSDCIFGVIRLLPWAIYKVVTNLLHACNFNLWGV